MRRVLAAVLVVALLAPTAVAQGEDTAEPRIEWSSPWERGPYEGPPEAEDDADPDWTAANGTIDLVATIHDESAIESVELVRRYEGAVNGRVETDRRTISLGATERIDETIHLGTHGWTTLTITVRDVAGNTHVSRITVAVDDTAAPTATLSATPAGDGMVRVRGTVSDDTQVDTVRLHAVSATKIVNPRQGSLDITDNSVTIDTRVQAPPKGVDGAVTVDLVDRAGNTRTIKVPVGGAETPTATAAPTPRPTATPRATPTATPPATPDTIAPTATATPINLTGLPTQTPESSGSGFGILDGLKLIAVGIGVLAGVVVVASQVTGGRY
ncbi:hypothetical protein [Haloplanus halophilus]|uniref:hypothetical protein n=1 Tax=Haloplanus halophilus TaxID=2949993 RepID=UPI00203BE48D|nr:hypothetical protein [Haloplanus sp. GDY1]